MICASPGFPGMFYLTNNSVYATIFEHMYDKRSAMCGSFLNGDAAMLFDRLVRREYIDKGWSGDRKFRAETADGEQYLLRISPAEKKDAVALCYSRMKAAEMLQISMCRALEWGTCGEGVYFIQSWIDGGDAEAVIPALDAETQYRLGIAAGRDLRKLHTIPGPQDGQPWEQRYGRKIDRKLKMYGDCPLKYDDDACIISFINENRHLIADRPICYQHGDHHIGNMMLSNGNIVLIDFEKEDYGDPWEEFNRIVWSAQASPYFASGTVDGYFGGNVPELFWRLLALYICTNTLGSLPWAIPFGEGEIRVMKEQHRQVLEWYDHMNRIVPNWYGNPVRIRPVVPSDWEMYIKLLQDKEVVKTYMVPEEMDQQLAEKMFTRYQILSASHDRYVRTVCVGETPVGTIHDVGIRDSTVELGWALLPAYYNNGYCTRAVKLAMGELAERGYREVTAGAFEENRASLRVMEKSGMERSSFQEPVSYRGENHLCVYYAIRLENNR